MVLYLIFCARLLGGGCTNKLREVEYKDNDGLF